MRKTNLSKSDSRLTNKKGLDLARVRFWREHDVFHNAFKENVNFIGSDDIFFGVATGRP